MQIVNDTISKAPHIQLGKILCLTSQVLTGNTTELDEKSAIANHKTIWQNGVLKNDVDTSKWCKRYECICPWNHEFCRSNLEMGNFNLVTEYNHWVFFLPVYTYLENCSWLATQKWGEGILAQGCTSQHKSPSNSMQSGLLFLLNVWLWNQPQTCWGSSFMLDGWEVRLYGTIPSWARKWSMLKLLFVVNDMLALKWHRYKSHFSEQRVQQPWCKCAPGSCRIRQ